MTAEMGFNQPRTALEVAVAADPPSPVVASFVAVCGACSWEGRPRRDNLTALGDFDAHVATDEHAWAVLNATMADEDESI